MAHDFDKQYRETVWVLDDLASKRDLPAIADFDFHFSTAVATAQPLAAVSALQSEGFAAAYDAETRDIWVPVYALMVDIAAIWRHEKPMTEICLRYGFQPDGWGFSDASAVNLV
ncbi:hypothetical protein [Thalassobius sp. MITS945101]|uniref:hypothetical protein n=1 Tax=Thalassobius sp. MITS945101 TaxID=3096994 RepID=UPI00399ADCA2